MNQHLNYESGRYGVKAIIKTAWRKSFLNELIDKEVVELELNHGKGWRGDDISFLSELPHLKSLEVTDFALDRIDSIGALHELRKLRLITYSKSPIDFHSFPYLKECYFEWIKDSNSLFEKSSLEKLFINNYPGKDSSVFNGLTQLIELKIMNSRLEEVEGLSSMLNLLYLRLTKLSRINSLKGIESSRLLREVFIQKCTKVDDISHLFELTALKKLSILDMGNIVSLKGIERLSDLEELYFYGSTSIADGDISPLCEMQDLRRVYFTDREHYSHKEEFFPKLARRDFSVE